MISADERSRSCAAIFYASIKKWRIWWSFSNKALFLNWFLVCYLVQIGLVWGQDSRLHTDSGAVAAFPLKSFALTSGYGPRTHPVTGERSKFHYGIDLRAFYEPVYSVLYGEVVNVGFGPVIGNFVRIKSGDFILTYGHLSLVLVVPGQQVYAGEAVAISGGSGRVTGPHLHLGMSYSGQPINPLRFLSELNNNLKH
ncbi:MAG: M23 family metallopeptidase [Chitinophagaceae bacterium]|nr:MAG: M23 family metallopeptidase [Chitinophagaceae bacterium]